jgi:hypothetical protein
MNLVYNGKSYHLRYDFGEDFPAHSAEYAFFEGNYSCDCNKSLFIRRYCDPTFPEKNCGDEIVIQDFKIIIETGV